MSSSLGSSTSSISQVSADNLGTIIVIPEVVGSQWSPSTISGLSPHMTG
jgi:hypothetical protein